MDRNDWKLWDGGATPVSDDTWVHIRRRDGSEVSAYALNCTADGLDWQHSGEATDIVAYMLAADRWATIAGSK